MADSSKSNDYATYSLSDVYDKIISSSLGGEVSATGNGEIEIVDIVKDFSWSKNKISSNGATLNSNFIPQCYLVERKQVVSSSIANLLNAFNSVSQTAQKLENSNIIGKLEQAFSGVGIITNKIGGLFNMIAGSETGESKEPEKTPSSTQANDPEVAQNGIGAIIKASITPALQAQQQPSETQGSGSQPTSGANEENKKTQKDKTKSNQKMFSSAVYGTMETVGNLIGKLIPSGLKEMSISADNHLSEKVLTPYSFMYFTKPTNKKYVFPVLGDAASTMDITQSFGDSVNTTSLLSGGSIGNMLYDISTAASSVVNDIISIVDSVTNNNNQLNQFFVEKAKYYSIPSSQTVTISFPLFNTVQKDAWKRNYKFLFNFIIRNMMFKTDSMTYRQPVFYDLYIPGFTRLPLTYVSNMKIQPYGIIRPLTTSDIVSPDLINAIVQKNSGNTSSGVSGKINIQVNVPEAWMVTITFTSLLAASSNQVLSSLSNSITVSSKVS